MNEDRDNDKDYQIMELKQRISYYEPYKQKYEDLKEDWKYIKSLLDKEFDERTRLKKENEQLRQTMQKVCELLEEEVDLFSDKATEHDVIAYREMQDFDNKDAYYICTATKKAIQMLKGRDSDE